MIEVHIICPKQLFKPSLDRLHLTLSFRSSRKTVFIMMELKNMLNLERGYSVTQPSDSVGSIVQWGNELRKVQSTIDRRRG